MHDDSTRREGSRRTRGTRKGVGESAAERKKPVVKPGLGRAQRKLYQELYRRAYVRRQGGGKAGKEALRELHRQQKRSSRSVRYLPLLFETEDGRYRLWTWEGPSKLFLRSVREAEGMRDLFFPAVRPTVISHTTDVNRHLRSACTAAASGVSIQALTHHERRAYAFLLWNECRRYEYLAALASDEDPLADDGGFRLASFLLVEALVRPLDFIRFLVDRVRSGIAELLEERRASEPPLRRSDPDDQPIVEFNATLDVAHSYLVASGLGKAGDTASVDCRTWFRRQAGRSERSEPSLRGEPTVVPYQMPIESIAGDGVDALSSVAPPTVPASKGTPPAPRKRTVKKSGHGGGKAHGKRTR